MTKLVIFLLHFVLVGVVRCRWRRSCRCFSSSSRFCRSVSRHIRPCAFPSSATSQSTFRSTLIPTAPRRRRHGPQGNGGPWRHGPQGTCSGSSTSNAPSRTTRSSTSSASASPFYRPVPRHRRMLRRVVDQCSGMEGDNRKTTGSPAVLL